MRLSSTSHPSMNNSKRFTMHRASRHLSRRRSSSKLASMSIKRIKWKPRTSSAKKTTNCIKTRTKVWPYPSSNNSQKTRNRKMIIKMNRKMKKNNPKIRTRIQSRTTTWICKPARCPMQRASLHNGPVMATSSPTLIIRWTQTNRNSAKNKRRLFKKQIW